MIQIQTRPSAEGIVNSLYSQQQERAEDMIDQMAKNFWPMIGTANQLAFMAIDDAIEAMKEAGMWKHQEKVKAQKAVEEYQKYEHQAWVHFTELGDDRYPLWQDLVGRAAQKLEPDILKLYFAIKNQIDKARVPNADVLAKIQVGVAMTTLATLMYDTLEAQFQSQTVINLRQAFCGGRITATEKNWRAVGEITGRKVMPNVNLRDDPACKLGVEVIMSRYERADFLNEAAKEAIECNPQIDYGV
mgnify:CR=1 FL=1